MSMKRKHIALSVLFGISLLSISACATKNTPSSQDDIQTTIELSQTILEMDVFDEFTLDVVTTGVGKITWTSGDTSIATVDEKGVIKAVGEGVTQITAKQKNATASCSIKVFNSYSAPVIFMNGNAIELGIQDEFMLCPTVIYKGTDCTETSTFLYTLEDTGYVTYEQVGRQVKLTGTAVGETACVVSTSVNGIDTSVRVPLKVKETSAYYFDTVDLLPTTSGYALTLYTLEDYGYTDKCKPNVQVLFNGKTVSTAVEYESENEDIVKINNDGYFEAKSVGKTVVKGTYGGNSFDVFVEVKKPVRNIEMKNLENIQVGKLENIEFSEEIVGMYQSAKIGDVEVGKTVENGKLVLDKSQLEKLPIATFGNEQTVLLETTKLYYSFPVKLYTLIINNADDYRMMGELSKSAYKDNSKLWGGYFVLGQDVDLTDCPMQEFIDRTVTNVAIDGTEGFAGVFDGKGHKLVGLNKSSNKNNAFISILHKNGVLKNTVFMNAKFTGNQGSFLCTSGYGTIQDVYLQYTEISNSGDNRGTIAGAGNLKMTRVIVDARTAVMDESSASFRFYATWSGTVDGKGYYVLAPEGYNLANADDTKTSEGIRSFYSMQALVAKYESDIAEWNKSFWYYDKNNAQILPLGVH